MKHKFGEWGEFIEAVHKMPNTWVPAAVLIIVEEAINRNCFKPEGLLEAIQQKLNYMKDPSKKREQL